MISTIAFPNIPTNLQEFAPITLFLYDTYWVHQHRKLQHQKQQDSNLSWISSVTLVQPSLKLARGAKMASMYPIGN